VSSSLFLLATYSSYILSRSVESVEEADRERERQAELDQSLKEALGEVRRLFTTQDPILNSIRSGYP
jgi:hypothetical protein